MRPPRGPSNSAADRGRPVVKRPLVPLVRLVLLAVVRMVNGLPATWLVGALGEVAQAISRIAPHGSVRVAKGGHVMLRTLMATLAIAVLSTGVAFADGKVEVKPKEFDPGKTFLVQADWLDGIGCPTSAHIAVPNADFTGVAGTAPYSDAGCPTGDTSDRHNQGLLLVKTGPTNNFASATAELKGVKGIHLTELGYDIRKPRTFADASGSHCGAGAPRFDVITSDNVDHFVGCASPPPLQTATGLGFLRLRWTAVQLAAAFPPILPTDTVKSITIIFDEGQDTAPDNFGLAVLDNIDINGTLVGRGDNAGANNKGKNKDKDKDKGDDNDQGENEND